MNCTSGKVTSESAKHMQRCLLLWKKGCSELDKFMFLFCSIFLAISQFSLKQRILNFVKFWESKFSLRYSKFAL